MTKLPAFSSGPSSDDESQPPPDESDLEIYNWRPYRRNLKFIGTKVSLTISALWILRNRPDKEAVDRKIEAGAPLDGEIYRAVIDLDELHGEYWDSLAVMMEILEEIYPAALKGKIEESWKKNGKLDEEMARTWSEHVAELGKAMERVEMCGRKLRISPHALRRLLKPPHLQEIKQDKAYDPDMKLDLPYLPSDMVHEILCRLPLNHIAIYKCVCKPWLDVFESESFVESHLSHYAPVLVVSMPGTISNWFNVFELEEDEDKLEHEHEPITKFDFPQVSTIQGSANGLLLLKNRFIDCFYVCNPFTREFIELRGPHACSEYDFYGFGVGKKRGKHKVVHINPEFGCHVYTLETGSSWRRIETTLPFKSDHRSKCAAGAFVNGNLHWLVVSNSGVGSRDRYYICCFDVERECFSIFFPPVTGVWEGLYTLGDYLCFHDFGTLGCDHVIWLLKKYERVKKYDADLFEPHNSELLREAEAEANICRRHWSEVDVILLWEKSCNPFQPIKIYPNGDMLILWNEDGFKYYCKTQRTIRRISLFAEFHDGGGYFNSILLTPNFLSLKRNFGLENVMAILGDECVMTGEGCSSD